MGGWVDPRAVLDAVEKRLTSAVNETLAVLPVTRICTGSSKLGKAD
jgi:hypothetical protein